MCMPPAKTRNLIADCREKPGNVVKSREIPVKNKEEIYVKSPEYDPKNCGRWQVCANLWKYDVFFLRMGGPQQS